MRCRRAEQEQADNTATDSSHAAQESAEPSLPPCNSNQSVRLGCHCAPRSATSLRRRQTFVLGRRCRAIRRCRTFRRALRHHGVRVRNSLKSVRLSAVKSLAVRNTFRPPARPGLSLRVSPWPPIPIHHLRRAKRRAVQVAEVRRVTAAVSHLVVIQVIRIRPLKPTARNLRPHPPVELIIPAIAILRLPVERISLIHGPLPAMLTVAIGRPFRSRLRLSDAHRYRHKHSTNRQSQQR